MPSVPQILEIRARRRKSAGRISNSRTGLGCALLFSLFLALSALILTMGYLDVARDLPSVAGLPELLEPPGGVLLTPTRLYDRSGEHVLLELSNPAAGERRYLKLPPQDETPRSGDGFLPSTLISATLATADPDFWSHPGFLPARLGTFDHATLAQKLVADHLLWQEAPGLRRALRERILAARATHEFGREKILEWYLNHARYGPLAYGAEAGARLYFDKGASELSFSEAALLAAAAEAPDLHPLIARSAAIERQEAILHNMLTGGWIRAEQAASANRQPPALRPEGTATLGMLTGRSDDQLAPAFTHLALEQLVTQIDRARLERGGLRVITTLDYDLQLQADCASAAQLSRLSDPQHTRRAADGSPCTAADLMPALPPGDSPPAESLAANVVALDPKTGEILALVGQPLPGLDPAHGPGHAPGSLLTPVVYLTAFTRGFSPASLVWDIPSEMVTALLPTMQSFHGPVRLRVAFANDYLVPAMQLYTALGQENVLQMAENLGFASLAAGSRPGSEILLDGGSVTLLEVVRAMGVFANDGILAGWMLDTGETTADNLSPITVQTVTGPDGEEWLSREETHNRPVISSQLSYLMTHVLSDEAARWPSLGHPNPLEIDRPAAVKMGSTTGGGDTWTVGYTPQMVIGVWMGRPHRGEGNSSSAPPLSTRVAASLWHGVMRYAHRDLASENWRAPAGITQMSVCDPSGLLPTADCPATVREIFLEGSEPTHDDTLFQRVKINRETGRKATVYTPPALIEEQVFMIVPPEAEPWAGFAGIKTQPEAYDIVPGDPGGTEGLAIESPDPLETVNGTVTIRGTANLEGMDSYRVQVGQGIYPEEWLLVAEKKDRVENSELAVWDTAGLNGLYAILLRAVRQDGSSETVVAQAVVDNQPPEAYIEYPAEGEVIELREDGLVTLQAGAVDELGLKNVVFQIDGQVVAILDRPPHAFPWNASPGLHTLRVRAIDQAGNFDEAEIEFRVRP